MQLLPIIASLVVLLVATPGFAVDDGVAVPTLTVSGEATVSVAPDRVEVSLGAVAQASAAGEAQSQVNAIMQRTIESILELDIDRHRIRTQQISLQPVYASPRRSELPVEPEIVGFRASNTVTVRLDQIDLVGRVIDAGIKSGANQLSGVSFTVEDDRAYRHRALQSAVMDARAKADAIVSAMGMRLAGVRQVTEGGVQVGRPHMEFAVARMASTPVEPGEVDVSASVTITFEIDAIRE